METQKLCWQIDGEWLTDFVRGWFWNENRPYETCKKLIASCVQSEDDYILTTITNEILEGRKKFVGINSFEYVDDNLNIRPISKKIEEAERKRAISEIRLHIITCGIDYIDPYSTVKSIRIAHSKNVTTAEECSIYFQYSDREQINVKNGAYAECLPAASLPTKAGLWLFEEPNVIYEATKNGEYRVGSSEFWENVYEQVKDRKGFEERNEYYLAKLRIENKNYSADVNTFDKTNCDDFGVKPKTDALLSSWSGLLSPDGDFYPADFGYHESVAFRILSEFGIEMGEQVTVFDDGKKFWNGCHDDALHVLLKKGWIAFRYIGRHYIEDSTTYSDATCRWKPTKIQKEIVWEQVIRHNVNSNILSEIYH